ncbi:MAG: hypothetical protein Q8P67_05110 [archaeon]|nr:hypothetical protein [archaeon]
MSWSESESESERKRERGREKLQLSGPFSRSFVFSFFLIKMLGYEVSVDDAVTQSLNNEEASQVTVYVVRVSREARGLCVMLRFVETLLLLLLLLVFFFLIYSPPSDIHN